MYLLEGPDLGQFTGKGKKEKKKEEKSPALGRIQTHYLLIMGHALYRCVTTSAS